MRRCFPGRSAIVEGFRHPVGSFAFGAVGKAHRYGSAGRVPRHSRGRAFGLVHAHREEGSQAGARSGRGARRCHDDSTGVLKVREKLANYSFCLQRIRPFIRPFNAFIGSHKSNREWDAPKVVMEEMLDVGAFILKHLPTLVQLGAPIWVTQANTLYDKFSRKALPAR